MIKPLTLFACLLLSFFAKAQSVVAASSDANSFAISNATIYVDNDDHQLVQVAAGLLKKDLEAVTGKTFALAHTPGKSGTAIIIGSADKSSLIQSLIKNKKLGTKTLTGKWEAYTIQTISNPFNGISNAIIIAGSDRRGTAYGVFELSKQIGVSPWYWWADVPVKKAAAINVKKNIVLHDAPKVKYRGIFINDEAPALSGWSREKFGGFNSQFYEKVFELILRLKGNYLWPAMWGNAFYDDDSLNIRMADAYGIVIGTSHHEPLMRAHAEWRKYGKGLWNYDSNKIRLQEFWRGGMQRATNEKIVSVGMRGDGDAPMSRETATALLENIVKDQRQIITEVTGKDAGATPQLWALYKEVQDYYDKGMRVPDDVTLLLCDDNWGNIRKLPRTTDKPRKGGYGIYYHFDYVGGPRNYKWVNTNPLPRIWEQMHLAWAYNVHQIWIVNVGDIKPMEFPISFFLDYAWDPEKINADQLQSYTENWAAAQFGPEHAKGIADILAKYAKYNSRRKPELLDANTYSLYREWYTVAEEYRELLEKAETINNNLPAEQKDAYFQLVLHPVKACANLYEMYLNVALNKDAYANRWADANEYADKVKELYANDSLITLAYHQLGNGKWNHMMSQTHIGYTYWQQPNRQRMPEVKYVPRDSMVEPSPLVARDAEIFTGNYCKNCFHYEEGYGVSIEAHHFARSVNTNGITWKILPDHGRTSSAITPFPVTASEQKPGGNSPHVEYDFTTSKKGEVTINAYFSPSLNIHNSPEGLQYAISIDGEAPQVISLNKEDKTSSTGIWNKWAAENIIIKSSKHNILTPGKHTVKYWMVNPAVVFQKLVIDFGDTEKSYLGPPETINEKQHAPE